MKRFLILLVAFMLLLCACESSASQKKGGSSAAVEQYIAEISEQTYSSAEQPTSEGKELEEVLFSLAQYEVKMQDESACEITITAPDMDRLIDRMNRKCNSAEEGTEFLMDALLDGDYETVTNTVRVELDEDGKPVETYEFVDAMYGGLLSKFEELLQEVRGDE